MKDVRMTENLFDLLLSRFGADMDAWPRDVRADAQAFAATPAGKRILATDALLRDASSQPLSADDDAFLNRLLDIPHQHENQVAEQSGLLSRMIAALDLRDVRIRFFSPVGLMAQTACYGAVLVVGVLIGMSGNQASTGMELDLSSGLFASVDPLMLEEQVK